MLNRIKQLKKLWTLTNKDPEYLKVIEKLSQEDIKDIPQGNGKATFMPLMTDEERNDYLENQEPMWNKFNKKIKQILK